MRVSQENAKTTRNQTILQKTYQRDKHLGYPPNCKILRTILEWTSEEFQQIDQRIRKFMTMHKALHLRDIDSTLCINKRTRKRKTGNRNNTNNARIKRITINWNKIWKKNNCMDISSDKQAKSHMRKLEHDSERGNLKRKLNLF